MKISFDIIIKILQNTIDYKYTNFFFKNCVIKKVTISTIILQCETGY